MTLAIMQPYLFPYIGYWQLINTVDTFVVYDNIQFTKKGWFNRNNILLNGKKTLFSIPLKKESSYVDVVNRHLANNSEKEIIKIISQIKNGYKKAPYFNAVFPIIEEIFLNKENNLFMYIFSSIQKMCKYLDINTKIVVSSSVNIDSNLKSQDKVLAISKVLNATKYVNSIGGRELYSKKDFEAKNIQLLFLESEVLDYKQFENEFVPYLSIIDVLMFNSKDEIKIMLGKYKLI